MSDPDDAAMKRDGGPSAAEQRRARQKAALKANMARRKTQARAVSARNTGQDDPGREPEDGAREQQE